MDNKIYEMELVEKDRMPRLVKFSDRLPTEKDCDGVGYLFVMDVYGHRDVYQMTYTQRHSEDFEDWFWMENVPEPPKPRTLEDVVREFLSSYGDVNRRLKLRKEMREILEKGKDDGPSR